MPAVEYAPLMSLDVLLASDASVAEIRSRIRLNVAIRMLIDAIEEAEGVAS